jgi:hypothetical protein
LVDLAIRFPIILPDPKQEMSGVLQTHERLRESKISISLYNYLFYIYHRVKEIVGRLGGTSRKMQTMWAFGIRAMEEFSE